MTQELIWISWACLVGASHGVSSAWQSGFWREADEEYEEDHWRFCNSRSNSYSSCSCLQERYYARHYAFDGFSDKITVFLYDGDAVVQNTKYDLKVYPPCGEEVVSRTSDGFSVNGGEYGLYFFALQYNEKTTEFGLENANDWWRTSIILRLSEDGSGLEQVNCVFNNNPPFIETRKILWKES